MNDTAIWTEQIASLFYGIIILTLDVVHILWEQPMQLPSQCSYIIHMELDCRKTAPTQVGDASEGYQAMNVCRSGSAQNQSKDIVSLNTVDCTVFFFGYKVLL